MAGEKETREEPSKRGMVEITRRNLARGNIITAAHLGIQRVNNEKGGAAFENAEIMPPGRRENGRDSREEPR